MKWFGNVEEMDHEVPTKRIQSTVNFGKKVKRRLRKCWEGQIRKLKRKSCVCVCVCVRGATEVRQTGTG